MWLFQGLFFGSLFTSALLFLMGGGVINTQLSLRMAQAGFSTPLIGQQFLNFGNAGGQNVFFIAALLFSLSLIPVAGTRSVHPELPGSERYTFKALIKKAPVGMSGGFAAGLIGSASFSMAPDFATKIGLSKT